MSKILLTEDDDIILKNLSELLADEGYEVITAKLQVEAMQLLETVKFDLLLLDVSLPDGNGYVICTQARQHHIPVIFITAAANELSVVTGLNLGADDYITKPFRPLELLSRIKMVLRRNGKVQSVFEIEDLRIDTNKACVLKNNREIFLSALEYKILLVFIQNIGIVLSRNKLLEAIWDFAGEFVNDNTLTVYIKRLREKIENDPQNPTIIKTVRGIGYKVGD